MNLVSIWAHKNGLFWRHAKKLKAKSSPIPSLLTMRFLASCDAVNVKAIFEKGSRYVSTDTTVAIVALPIGDNGLGFKT